MHARVVEQALVHDRSLAHVARVQAVVALVAVLAHQVLHYRVTGTSYICSLLNNPLNKQIFDFKLA